MNAVLMRQWTKDIWLKHTKKDRSLLILDHFKAHLEDEVSSCKTSMSLGFYLYNRISVHTGEERSARG